MMSFMYEPSIIFRIFWKWNIKYPGPTFERIILHCTETLLYTRHISNTSNCTHIIVTAADVLHSWTVPRLGVKTDATPGRLNQVRFSINRPGLLHGQCSEIFGANYRFMPIVIERVSIYEMSVKDKRVIRWLKASNGILNQFMIS